MHEGGTSLALRVIPRDYRRGRRLVSFGPLDRIDSAGHYEPGNLQIVCRFVNFWKGASDDREFRRLIKEVRTMKNSD